VEIGGMILSLQQPSHRAAATRDEGVDGACVDEHGRHDGDAGSAPRENPDDMSLDAPPLRVQPLSRNVFDRSRLFSIGSATMSVASTGGVDVRPTAKGRRTAALR
jgi:hypothetical protein